MKNEYNSILKKFQFRGLDSSRLRMKDPVQVLEAMMKRAEKDQVSAWLLFRELDSLLPKLDSQSQEAFIVQDMRSELLRIYPAFENMHNVVALEEENVK